MGNMSAIGLSVSSIAQLTSGAATDWEAVLRTWRGLGAFSFLTPPRVGGNDSLKVLIRRREGAPAAVLFLSPRSEPDQCERVLAKRERIRAILGPRLGEALLRPLASGWVEGVSYQLMPYRRPLPETRWRWIATRRSIRKPLLGWLREATERSVRELDAGEREAKFSRALRALADNRSMPAALRARADAAIRRLEDGSWRPRVVVAHNDLFRNNILRAPAGSPVRFVIIDWRGADERGLPIYDLVRLGMNLRLPARQWRAELIAHGRILGCEPIDTMSYLLASLGDLGLHLEQFPEDQYLALAERCYEALRPHVEALGPSEGEAATARRAQLGAA